MKNRLSKVFLASVIFLAMLGIVVSVIGVCNIVLRKKPLHNLKKEEFLTPHQLQWLEEHPVIKAVRSNRYYPLNFKGQDGNWQGLNQEYFIAVEQILGVEFQDHKRHVLKSKYKSLEDKELDVCLSSFNVEREEKIDYTDTYFLFRLMIFADKDSNIFSLDDLSGKVLAIKDWKGVSEQIKEKFPQVIVNKYATSNLTLQAVKDGRAQAALFILPKGLHHTKANGFSNIELKGKTDYKVGLVVAVRDDWPEFVEILNKTFSLLEVTYRPALEKLWYRDLGNSKIVTKDFIFIIFVSMTLGVVILCFLYRAKVRSDQKAIEEKRLNEEKSRFFASVSHDLRNPLALLVGMLELIDEKEEDNNHREYIQTALYSSNTLLNLLNQVLDFSQMEAGKMAIYPQAHELRQLIAQSVKIYQLTQNNTVIFDYKFFNEEDVPKWVLVDELRLQQVLSNLIGNALKFTERGSVHLDVNWLKQPENYSLWDVVDFPEKSSFSGYLILDIHDTGTGMESEKVEQLFQPYVQESHKGARPKGNGLGLGLSICKDLIDLMGGRMKAHSVLGSGSTFSILIPLQEADAPQDLPIAVKTCASKSASGHGKVLVVDDDAVYRKLVKIQCESLGVQVLISENGSEALELMQTEDFDCVFMDVEMVGLSGGETVRVRREYEQVNKQAPILIIALTGHTNRNEELLNDGFDRVYTKPIAKKDLISVLLK